MKNLQSTVEGIWIELNPVQLTEEQRTLLRSNNQSDAPAKAELISLINSQRESPASGEDAGLASSKYNEIKPTLKEGDTYQLISCDVIINQGHPSGILNCRVNGEHIQVRF